MERIGKRLKKISLKLSKMHFLLKLIMVIKKLPNKILIELSELMDQSQQTIYLNLIIEELGYEI